MVGSTSSVPSLEIFLLGRFSVRVAGREVDLDSIPGRKAQTLLKLLALQRNHQIIRDQAIDLLWPDLNLERGAGQLYKAIYHLRQVLSNHQSGSDAESWIDLTEELIRLAPFGRVVTDIGEFKELARRGLSSGQLQDIDRATALYTGDLLPMDLYVDWTSVPRDHLQQLYLDVLLALADQHRLHRNLPEAAEYFRQALAKDPLLEKAHRGLIQVYALQGQTDRSMRQFSRCVHVLEKELGLEPSPETRELIDEIRNQHVQAVGQNSHKQVPEPVVLNPLVNRVNACRTIELVLNRVSMSGGCMLSITGPAGIGKTRIAHELITRAKQRGYRAFRGKTREMEGSVAYSPFIELVETALQVIQNEHEPLPEEIAAAIPEYDGPSQPVPSADRHAARTYLFARLTQFFQHLAKKSPAVLVLEDLHAADNGTIELFHYLARHIDNIPVLLAITYRNDRGRVSRQLNRRILNLELPVETAELDSLNEEEHAKLLEQLAAPRPVTSKLNQKIYQLSEGNPFFAAELYRYYRDEGKLNTDDDPSNGRSAITDFSQVPPSLHNLVLERVHVLTPAARHLLCLAAAAGRTVSFDVLHTAVQEDHLDDDRTSVNRTLDLLDHLVDADLLEERGLHYRFRHALFRTAVYETISRARRRALHSRIAQSLVKLSDAADEQPVEQIAFHYTHAGNTRSAVHYLIQAGERAEAVYAHEDALAFYRDALELLESEDELWARRTKSTLYERTGDVHRAAGYLEKSFEAYERALGLLDDVSVSRIRRAELHRKMALSAIYATAMDTAADHLNQAQKHAADDARTKARIQVVRALYHWHLNQLETSIEEAYEALTLAEAAEASTEIRQAYEMLSMASLPLGRWEEGMKYEMRRKQLGWSPDIVVATDAHLCLWEYHVQGRQPIDAATRFIQTISEEAADLGDLRCVAVCHYALGTMHLWRGNTGESLEELLTSRDLHHRVGSPAGIAYCLARTSAVQTAQGALQAGWDTAHEGLEYARQAAIRDHCLQRLYGVALWNRIEAKDVSGTVSLVDKTESFMKEIRPCTWCSLELLPWLVLHYLKQGEISKAAGHTCTLEELCATTGNPVSRALARISRSGIEAAAGNFDRARQLRAQTAQLLQDQLIQGSTSSLTQFFDHIAETHSGAS